MGSLPEPDREVPEESSGGFRSVPCDEPAQPGPGDRPASGTARQRRSEKEPIPVAEEPEESDRATGIKAGLVEIPGLENGPGLSDQAGLGEVLGDPRTRGGDRLLETLVQLGDAQPARPRYPSGPDNQALLGSSTT